MKAVLCLILLVPVLMGGCTEPTSPASSAGTNPSDLQGPTWVLVKMIGEDGGGVQVTPYRVVVRFDSVGSVSGRGPVNRYGGVFHATATGGMTIDSLFTTAALGDGVDLEDRYLEALHKASRFETSDSMLHIFFLGRGVLEFDAE